MESQPKNPEFRNNPENFDPRGPNSLQWLSADDISHLQHGKS